MAARSLPSRAVSTLSEPPAALLVAATLKSMTVDLLCQSANLQLVSMALCRCLAHAVPVVITLELEASQAAAA